MGIFTGISVLVLTSESVVAAVKKQQLSGTTDFQSKRWNVIVILNKEHEQEKWTILIRRKVGNDWGFWNLFLSFSVSSFILLSFLLWWSGYGFLGRKWVGNGVMGLRGVVNWIILRKEFGYTCKGGIWIKRGIADSLYALRMLLLVVDYNNIWEKRGFRAWLLSWGLVRLVCGFLTGLVVFFLAWCFYLHYCFLGTWDSCALCLGTIVIYTALCSLFLVVKLIRLFRHFTVHCNSE